MKKILVKFLFCVGLLFGLSGCSNVVDEQVTLSIVDGTLTNRGITLQLENASSTDYLYDEFYYIEKKVNEKWIKLETIHDGVFNLPAWSLKSNDTVEIDIDWQYIYGQLESGKYRIVKEIFKTSGTEINNGVGFEICVEFDIDSDDYVYDVAITEEIELKTEMEVINHGSSEEEYTEYKAYVKNNKLYAKNLKTNEEKIIFDKENVKNIASRNICCAGNAHLLILTTDGNVYMSDDDSNYNFTFDIKFNKLDAENIVSFKLVPTSDYDFTKNLYGVDSNGNEILLHKIS